MSSAPPSQSPLGSQGISSRPRLPERPCPACGARVEPLRAREVVLLEDGFRYLCDADCRARFVAGERDFDAPRRAAEEAP